MDILRAGTKKHWEHNNIRANLSLNYTCNFSCSYCSLFNIRKHKLDKFLSLDTLHRLIKDILSLDRDSYYFSISGGEPSLYKHLVDCYQLVQKYNKANTTIGLCTNGSHLNKLLECIKAAPDIYKKLSISIHEEQRSLDEYKILLEDFIVKAKDYKNFECNIIYLLYPTHLKKALEFKGFAENLGFNFILQTLTIDGKIAPNYTEEEIKLLNQYGTELDLFVDVQNDDTIETNVFKYAELWVNPQLMNYKDMYCTSGATHVNITPEGKVYRCFYDKTGVDFSINENSILNYPNFVKVAPCQVEQCACMGIIAVPKWKKGIEPPHYINKNMLAD